MTCRSRMVLLHAWRLHCPRAVGLKCAPGKGGHGITGSSERMFGSASYAEINGMVAGPGGEG